MRKTLKIDRVILRHLDLGSVHGAAPNTDQCGPSQGCTVTSRVVASVPPIACDSRVVCPTSA